MNIKTRKGICNDHNLASHDGHRQAKSNSSQQLWSLAAHKARAPKKSVCCLAGFVNCSPPARNSQNSLNTNDTANMTLAVLRMCSLPFPRG